ncbi:MAG: amidohydrolase family protein, partial [Acidimicrobiia bacterium]|nr:amidohydrolase family protein [Acidimicrobiia bacterium]
HGLPGVDGALGRRRLVQALEGGVDVVGACPHLDEDPLEAIDNALDAAVDAGTRVDLHFDEVLDVSVQHLPELARRVEARGLGGKVVASHCVSHGLLSPDRQREVGRLLADAGVAVVANPRTNLFLQSRGIEAATPRGLAGVRALLESGVVVAAGADNVQDPFYVIGRSDPLETAALLVSVAHLTVDEAWTLVSSAVREVMGLEGVAVEVGAPADLIAASGASIREVIADQPADRMVFRRGELVSRTSVETWVA